MRCPCAIWAGALIAAGLTCTSSTRADGGAPPEIQGIALSCAHPDEEDVGPDEAPPPNLRVAAMLGNTTVGHAFSVDGGEVQRQTLTASIAWRAIDQIVLFGDVGAIVAGDATLDGASYDVDPGPRGGLGLAWRALPEDGYWPYVMLAARVSLLSSTTHVASDRPRLTAFDFRSSLTIGKMLGPIGKSRVGAYIVARSVTGGLYWKVRGRTRSVRPDDALQGGIGLTAAGPVVDAFVEVAPIGETSAVVGIGASF